jgi:hypothetical protein
LAKLGDPGLSEKKERVMQEKVNYNRKEKRPRRTPRRRWGFRRID